MQYCIAVDVAKKDCMIGLFSHEIIDDNSLMKTIIKPKKYKSDYVNLNSFLDELKKKNIICENVVMEATGCYHQKDFTFFKEGGFNVTVLNPLLTSGKNKSDNSIRKQKDDKIDCQKIAKTFFNKEVNVQRNYGDKKWLDNKLLSREISNLTDELSIHKIKLRNYLQYTNPSVECALDGQDLFTFSVLAAIKELPHAKQMAGKRVDGIVGIMERSVIRPTRGKSFETNARKLKAYSDNSIASVDEDSIICTVLIPETIEDIISLTRKIDKLSRKIVDLYKDNLLYKTIYEYDGIGKSSAAQIACEIGRIEDYKKINQLIASTGLDPRIDESGTSVNIKRKISKKGNKYLRTLLFQTVESILMIEARNGTSQLPDSMSTYYEKKHSDENKHHYAALVACSTKLITRIFYRYKDNYAKQLEQQKE